MKILSTAVLGFALGVLADVEIQSIQFHNPSGPCFVSFEIGKETVMTATGEQWEIPARIIKLKGYK